MFSRWQAGVLIWMLSSVCVCHTQQLALTQMEIPTVSFNCSTCVVLNEWILHLCDPHLLSVKSFGTVDWICNPCSQPGLGVGFFCSFEVGNISKAREMSATQVRVLKWVIPASKRDEGTLGKMKRKSPFLLWNISRQSIFGSIDKIGSFSGIWMH